MMLRDDTVDIGTTGAKVASWEHDNPRNLVLLLRQQYPDADEQVLAQHLRDRVLDDDSEYLLPILRYFVRVTLRALEPRPHTRKSTREEVEQTKRKIESRLLDFIMPNGKTLANSSGAECAHAGGWLAAIAKHVKPDQIVGDVLDEAALRRMFKQARK